ncbi:hypothetical protein [Mycoplasma todarodis]|uniref:hypothetical protein n=1 Tax=Mycoplasma todarodis TaxID=1937191 RepID=UPI003B380381
MNISKKQISLGALAAVAVVAVPVATVISCGKKDTNKADEKGTVTINVEEMKTPAELFSKINETLNNYMPEKASIIGTINPKDKEATFEKIKSYMGKIKTDAKFIKLKFKDKVVVWDLSELNKTINDANAAIALGFDKVEEKSVIKLMLADNPAMAVYVAAQSSQGITFGTKLQGFANLPKGGFEAYKSMLRAYHKLALEFIDSDIYAEWIKGKEFILPKGDLDLAKPVIEIAKPGEKYDLKKNRPNMQGLSSKEFVEEGNNFEAQWVLSIMNMY